MSDWNSSLDDQNSSQDWKAESVEIDPLTTPESIQERFGISKSTYYDDVRFLKGQGYTIESHKDGEKRVILEPATVQLISALREHVTTTGSREGFKYGGLSVVGETGLGDVAADGPMPTPDYEAATGSHLDDMVRQAQQLAAHNLVMGNQVIAEMARQIGYEDLPDDLKQQVDHARAATVPKTNPAEIASRVLTQWRSQRGATAA
jgi:hypothetical protein